MSNNQPFIGITSNSSCSHPSFPFLNPMKNLPLCDDYSSRESLSIPLELNWDQRLTKPLDVNSALEHELFEDPTQTSTGYKDKQSVTVAGFSRKQNPENEQRLHSSSDNSSSCYLDSEHKSYSHPKDEISKNHSYIPEDLRDSKNQERRQRNNLAAKKWRDGKRRRAEFLLQRLSILEVENIRLRLELSSVQEQNEILKRCIYQH